MTAESAAPGAGPTQPRVRRNEWRALRAPDLGSWEPSLSVSVVIPAYDAGRLLPTVLAGLAAQTYPAHLLEVIVVDDGPGPAPLSLPDLRPEHTRIVRVEGGWGRANACHTGALAAEGDVVHWLDADMLVAAEHVEAQLRWHHLIDHAVTLGHKWFVDPAPVLAAGPDAVRTAVAQGEVAAYFADQTPEPHDWVETIYDRTDDLHTAGPRALRTHVGATAAVRRDLYRESGGMDTALRLGEDIVLGYRLAETGAVFVPDRQARSWHLGASHVMTQREQVNDYNDHFLADRAPDLRAKRRPGRSYAVPYLDVVLDVRGHQHSSVTAVVDAVLRGTLHDLVVTLLGDWSDLDDARRSPLADPLLSTRLVHATYAAEPRVRLRESLPEGRPDAMFQMTLDGADWAPQDWSLTALLLHLEDTHDGLRQVLSPDGRAARIERTAAYARARRVALPGEDLDDVVDAVAGSAWVEAGDAGFVAVADLTQPTVPRTGGPPRTSEQAWAHVDKVVASGTGTAPRGRRGGSDATPPPRGSTDANPTSGPRGPSGLPGLGSLRGAVSRLRRRG